MSVCRLRAPSPQNPLRFAPRPWLRAHARGALRAPLGPGDGVLPTRAFLLHLGAGPGWPEARRARVGGGVLVVGQVLGHKRSHLRGCWSWGVCGAVGWQPGSLSLFLLRPLCRGSSRARRGPRVTPPRLHFAQGKRCSTLVGRGLAVRVRTVWGNAAQATVPLSPNGRIAWGGGVPGNAGVGI